MRHPVWTPWCSLHQPGLVYPSDASKNSSDHEARTLPTCNYSRYSGPLHCDHLLTRKLLSQASCLEETKQKRIQGLLFYIFDLRNAFFPHFSHLSISIFWTLTQNTNVLTRTKVKFFPPVSSLTSSLHEKKYIIQWNSKPMLTLKIGIFIWICSLCTISGTVTTRMRDFAIYSVNSQWTYFLALKHSVQGESRLPVAYLTSIHSMAPVFKKTNCLLSLLSPQPHLKPDILVLKCLDWGLHRNT